MSLQVIDSLKSIAFIQFYVKKKKSDISLQNRVHNELKYDLCKL